MSINYFEGKICLNVLAKDLDNAVGIYEAAEQNVVVGVLSSNYDSAEDAIKDMSNYMTKLQGNLSVGLGAGNPNQCKVVAEIVKEIKANHINQVFSAVGYTRSSVDNTTSHINALVSPTGQPGMVKISTGPLSSKEEAAIVPIKTAIAMIKEMGGNAIKFYPMGGLKYKDELLAVAQACADSDFILEPTGGIDLDNYEEIIDLILSAGVKKIIPHVYTSIIDPISKNTRIEDVRTLVKLTKKCLTK